MRRALPWLLLLPCLALGVPGCASKSRIPEDCKQLYVILPGNFVIDLAAGSQVFLDPASQEFALFCAAAKAQAALKRASPEGDWRVYRVGGSFGEIAVPVGDGEYALGRPAEVIDWVEIQ